MQKRMIGVLLVLVLVLLFVCGFGASAVMTAKRSWVMAQVLDAVGESNPEWCQDLPKNVCVDIPQYCKWDTSDPSMIMCKNKN